MSPSPTDLYAALDLGTNSCRMLIAQSRVVNFMSWIVFLGLFSSGLVLSVADV